jgi:3-hydroxybutyryl-CoA dehydrogenase
MGSQIGMVYSFAGYRVTVQDIEQVMLDTTRAQLQDRMARNVEKGRTNADDAHAALARMTFTTDLEHAAASADFIIEAAVEKLDVKRDIFARLDHVAPEHTVLATNSSTIGISKLADATSRPELCCNMHFFYPPLVMDLVEVVKGPRTSDETVRRARDFAQQIGRTAVLLNKEIDGFIVNRILHAATQEAYRLLDAGVASFEDIDTAVEKGLNWPMGPFRLGDFSGLDVTYNARLHMYRTTGDERYRPSPQLEAKVKAGELGRKTGRGWYVYEEATR